MIIFLKISLPDSSLWFCMSRSSTEARPPVTRSSQRMSKYWRLFASKTHCFNNVLKSFTDWSVIFQPFCYLFHDLTKITYAFKSRKCYCMGPSWILLNISEMKEVCLGELVQFLVELRAVATPGPVVQTEYWLGLKQRTVCLRQEWKWTISLDSMHVCLHQPHPDNGTQWRQEQVLNGQHLSQMDYSYEMDHKIWPSILAGFHYCGQNSSIPLKWPESINFVYTEFDTNWKILTKSK